MLFWNSNQLAISLLPKSVPSTYPAELCGIHSQSPKLRHSDYVVFYAGMPVVAEIYYFSDDSWPIYTSPKPTKSIYFLYTRKITNNLISRLSIYVRAAGSVLIILKPTTKRLRSDLLSSQWLWTKYTTKTSQCQSTLSEQRNDTEHKESMYFPYVNAFQSW